MAEARGMPAERRGQALRHCVSPDVKPIALLATAAVLALAGCGSDYGDPSNSSGSSSASISTAKAGGHTVLVDGDGMTIYSLSAEKEKGRFVCTDKKCLAAWTPVPGQAEGVDGLSTVARPDGSHQAAYKGHPLYTFSGDKAKGDINGQGVKDVGTWRAVTVSGKPASGGSGGGGSGGGGGGGYGGY
jgi:predicted lipoprotein with Yx(FWY)xxD motif